MSDSKERRPVRQLSAEVARKIAAGEVIDRPCAIVRELMDNAVDSGANSITVEIKGGGIESIRVCDNGSGMTKDDLFNCARPHATSKITDSEDLMALTTLGFRGEALSSIAAVSELSIASGNFKMTASVTEDHKITEIPPVQNGRGTVVTSERLFENFPARRVFLKRPATESTMCKDVFVEKSIPRTDISFRLTVDGQIKLDLPSNVSQTERFLRALQIRESESLFFELEGKSADFEFKIIIGEPSVFRTDRKQIFIYVNGRRVQEFSLMQALEYGCMGFFPNGTHPVSALFVKIDPSLVDFNIHPAKKEVRFKDVSELHHAVSSTVKNFFRSYGIQSPKKEKLENSDEADSLFSLNTENTENYGSPKGFLDSAFSENMNFEISHTERRKEESRNYADSRSKFFSYETSPAKKTFSERNYGNFSIPTAVLASKAISEPSAALKTDTKIDTTDETGFSFLGTALDCFLVAQIDDTIYFIDQHAAHERILFDKILSSPVEKQELLIPYTLKTSSKEEDDYLNSILPSLSEAGFNGKQTSDGVWEFSTVSARWKGSEEDFKTAVLEKKVNGKDIIYSVAAMTACKAAIKDGYLIDRETAKDLAKQALSLKDPHCPHGRPIWTTITKEQLFARVRRTL